MPLSLNLTRYLPPDAGPRLKAYKYSGEDRSYIYKYFWRPTCVKLVNYLPRWLAPNVITVTALVLVLIAHALFAYYMPDLTLPSDGEQPPPWVFYYAAVSLFLYQLLDNMDGHQARRTGTSSPLGLLMDHGCDALNTCVGSLSAASALCMGPTWKTWSAVMIAVIVFFANTLEEYYRGSLVLPVINGANEGIVLVVVCYVLSGYYGAGIWLQTFRIPAIYVPVQVTQLFKTVPLLKMGEGLDLETGDLVFQLNTVLLALMVGSGVMCTLGNIYELWVATRKKKADRDHGAKYGVSWLCREYPFFHSLTRAIPLIGISILANLWFFCSPSIVFQAHPRIYCWTVGLLYTKLSIHLMIAHLCSTEFHPFRRTLVPFFAIGLHWFLSAFVGAKNVQLGLGAGNGIFDDEELLLFEFFALSCATFLHLVVNAVLETKEALGVPVWTMPKVKKN